MSSFSSEIAKVVAGLRRSADPHAVASSMASVETGAMSVIQRAASRLRLRLRQPSGSAARVMARFGAGRDPAHVVAQRAYKRLQELLGKLTSNSGAASEATANESVELLASLRAFVGSKLEDAGSRLGKPGEHPDTLGSGGWGDDRSKRGLTDYANKALWMGVVGAAMGWGYPNSARHMLHYLKNSGEKIQVDVDTMLTQIPKLREWLEQVVQTVGLDTERKFYAGGGSAVVTKLTGKKSVVVAREGDWHYALGGFTAWYTGEARAVPAEPEPRGTLRLVVHVYDRYDWDKGKSVTIRGIKVTDEQLGRLHRVGLAREFDVNGSSSPLEIPWTFGAAIALPGAQQP